MNDYKYTSMETITNSCNEHIILTIGKDIKLLQQLDKSVICCFMVSHLLIRI